MIVHVVEEVLLILLLVVWLSGAIWTYRNARRRIDDLLFLSIAYLIGLVPVAGPLAYLLIRPPETLDDVRVRRLEVQELEARSAEHRPLCPVCRTGVQDGFRVCPVCTTRLKEPCRACGELLEPRWLACPWCAAPALAPAPVEASPAEIEPVEADLDSALTAEAAAAAAAP